jgi:hypothetical protein
MTTAEADWNQGVDSRRDRDRRSSDSPTTISASRPICCLVRSISADLSARSLIPRGKTERLQIRHPRSSMANGNVLKLAAGGRKRRQILIAILNLQVQRIVMEVSQKSRRSGSDNAHASRYLADCVRWRGILWLPSMGSRGRPRYCAARITRLVAVRNRRRARVRVFPDIP